MPVGTPSKSNPIEVYSAFDTEEPFKAVAARLKTSPNTLRKQWVERFGKEAFDARGKRLQSKAAAAVGHSKKGSTYKVREITESCSSCGSPIQVNLIQKARSKRLLCGKCSESERGVDRICPVCNQGCVGVKGLAMHLAQVDDEGHSTYQALQEDEIWVDQEEGIDFVRCLVCGHRGVRVDRHISSEHGLSIVEYRGKFPGVEVQAECLRVARSESATRQHQESPRKGLTKSIACTSCGIDHEVGLTFASLDHRCSECREEERWDNKVELTDYVSCQACGYRSESLISHIRNAHPDLEGHYQEVFPGALVVSLSSSIRDKSYLKGKELSVATRELMSQNAGRWNKGLTKDTDSRMAQAAQSMLGRKSWRKGITKDQHSGVQSTADKMQVIRSTKFWTNGNEVTLTRDQLLPFTLKNGKVSVGKAIVGLGHAFVTIKRECERNGLKVARTALLQTICLETLALILDEPAYKTEWNDGSFINPKTGGRFRFDGFFPDSSLLVEFQGFQHFTSDSVWFFEGGESYEDLVLRDQEKAFQVIRDGRFKLFLVREDEPYADPEYLRGRLIDEGILNPGK